MYKLLSQAMHSSRPNGRKDMAYSIHHTVFFTSVRAGRPKGRDPAGPGAGLMVEEPCSGRRTRDIQLRRGSGGGGGRTGPA